MKMSQNQISVLLASLLTVLYLVQQSNATPFAGRFKSVSHNFDHFVFTQSWPQVVCVEGEAESHNCSISKNVTGWTIHGLWPTEQSTEGPFNCNDTNKFNQTAVQTLLPDLEAYWPNLYVDTAKYDFWEHEWSKHGTCASTVNATANEYLYFKKGLELFKTINLTKVMNRLDIIPNDANTYNVTHLLKQLTKVFNNIEPIIGCYKVKKQKRFYLAAVEICYSKQFEMIPCFQSSQITDNKLYFKSLNNLKEVADDKDIISSDRHLIECPSNGMVYYPTIQYN